MAPSLEFANQARLWHREFNMFLQFLYEKDIWLFAHFNGCLRYVSGHLAIQMEPSMYTQEQNDKLYQHYNDFKGGR